MSVFYRFGVGEVSSGARGGILSVSLSVSLSLSCLCSLCVLYLVPTIETKKCSVVRWIETCVTAAIVDAC